MEEEQEREFLESLFEELPKNYITILNPQKYRHMKSAILKIKGVVDDYLCRYDEMAEYSLRAPKVKSVLLCCDLRFIVRLPDDMDALIRVKEMRNIINEMGDDDSLQIAPCADGRIDLVFLFKDVYNLVSAE